MYTFLRKVYAFYNRYMSNLFNASPKIPILFVKGDSMAIDILQYEKLVYSIANKFYGVEKEDLVQAGFLGLAKAVKNYNSADGAAFSTYAYNYIYGEMYEAQTGARPIRLQKGAMKLYKSVNRYRDFLSDQRKEEVSLSEAASLLGVDYTIISDIANSLAPQVDIELEGISLTSEQHIDDMILFKECLASLDDLEKSVIDSRYVRDLSQSETAKILGLSQVKVSRIEKKSKEKMKEYMAS